MATARSSVFDPRLNDDLRAGIVATAKALGLTPAEVATMISYETGGTFNPSQPGPTTKYGQHRGLIQWGEPQAAQYGVDWGDPVASQLGENGAIVRYFNDRGWKPGMSALDAYSVINAGGPGRYDAVDNGTTVRQKFETQMAAHRRKAEALFGAGTTMAAPDDPRRDTPSSAHPVGSTLPGPATPAAPHVRHPPNPTVGVGDTPGTQKAVEEALKKKPWWARLGEGLADAKLGGGPAGQAGAIPPQPGAALAQVGSGNIIDPQQAEAQRQMMAMAMARLNSGQLWGM